jgi:hypothetical protein
MKFIPHSTEKRFEFAVGVYVVDVETRALIYLENYLENFDIGLSFSVRYILACAVLDVFTY